MGEWRETTKKKKRQTPSNSTNSKSDSNNHIEEESPKPEQTIDTEKPDRRERPESSNRRNKRPDTRPPRLANKGRGGRDKPEYFRSEKMNGDTEKYAILYTLCLLSAFCIHLSINWKFLFMKIYCQVS